jgi:hypothetical protein
VLVGLCSVPVAAQNAAPIVTQVLPSLGTGAGGTKVNIYGRNFAPGATVRFGEEAGEEVEYRSATQINAVTPRHPHPMATVGVAVTNPDGQSGALDSSFTYGLDLSSSSISRHTISDPQMLTKSTISVYLPPGHDESNQAYPVLYVLPHCCGAWFNSWTPFADRLIMRGEIDPLIIVGIPSAANFHENVLPYVERNFRILPLRAYRAIAGYSGGTPPALRLSRANVFSLVGIFAGGDPPPRLGCAGPFLRHRQVSHAHLGLARAQRCWSRFQQG